MVDHREDRCPDDDGLEDPSHPALQRPPTGHRVRRPADDDLPAVAALYERAAVRSRHGTTGRGALRADEDLRRTWSTRREDALVVEAEDGTVAGYLEFHEDLDPWTPSLDLYAEGRVDPRADARLVGAFLLARAMDRADRAAAREPTLPTTLRTTVVDAPPATLRWFAERGLLPERHLLRLRIDVGEGTPPPRWPAGVRGVPATAVDDEAIHAALVAAFADHHLGATDDLDDWRAVRLRTGRVELASSHAAVTDAATGGDEVVGVALGRLGGDHDPDLGTVTDLGVVPGWRGRGVATELLRSAFLRFAELGAVRVALEVDDVTLDGALRLYERAGMEVVHHAIVLTTGPFPSGADPARDG